MTLFKKPLLFTLILLLFQSMPVYCESKFYFRNCCKKTHTFSVIGMVTPFPCGKVKRVKRGRQHTFTIKIDHDNHSSNEFPCLPGKDGKYNFNGARNIIKVSPGAYIRTVSRKPKRGIRYCHAFTKCN